MKSAKLIQQRQPIQLITFFFLCFLFPISYTLSFAAKLEVAGNINASGNTSGIALAPFTSAAPPPNSTHLSEGRIYYNYDNQIVYLSEQSPWAPVFIPKNVATIIVAASNSSDKNLVAPDYQCNGTDDQDIINNAINAVNNTSGQGAVYLLEGDYAINRSIMMNGVNNISLVGAGSGTKLYGSPQYVISAANSNGVLISNLMVTGNSNTPRADGSAIAFFSVNISKIYQVWIRDVIAGGIRIGNSSRNLITRNQIDNTSGSGIWSAGFSSYNGISDNIVNTTQGIGSASISLMGGDTNNLIVGNYLFNSTYGIVLGNSSGSHANVVSANQIANINGSGIVVQGGSRDNLIRGNHIIDVVSASGNWGIFLHNGSRSVISENNLHNTTGIFLNQTNFVLFEGNIINTGNNRRGTGVKIVDAWRGTLFASNLIIGNFTPANPGINLTNSTNAYIAANQIIGPLQNRSLIINDENSSCVYTDSNKITFQPAIANLTAPPNTIYPGGKKTGDPLYSPASYFKVGSTAVLTANITNGTAAGDLLILMGFRGTRPITINETSGSINLNNAAGNSCTLSGSDTLELIWNGQNWVEIARSNN